MEDTNHHQPTSIPSTSTHPHLITTTMNQVVMTTRQSTNSNPKKSTGSILMAS